MAQNTVEFHWQSCSLAGQKPRCRSGAAMATVGSCTYVFGGAAGGENADSYGDMFCVDLESEVPEWREIEMCGAVPSPREGHLMHEVGGLLYVFGGSSDPDVSTCLSGMHTFDPVTKIWSSLATGGEEPQALNLTSVVVDSAIYTFGGILDGEGSNRLHIFDTASKQWSSLATSGQLPSPRGDHCSAAVGRKIYIFGGSGGEKLFFNDLHVLDIATLTWTKIEVDKDVPTAREFASICGYGDELLILFGGTTADSASETDFSDVHIFNIEDGTWQEVAVGGPVPDKRYSHCSVVWKNKMIVFGGLNGSQDFNDFNILQLPSASVSYTRTPPVRARYDLTTPVPAKRKAVPVAPPKTIRPPDFDELKSNLIRRVTEMFDQLSEKYFQLDKDKEQLRVEREAFEAERKANNDMYERQQQELKEMFELHRQQNEEWIQLRTAENDKDRQFIAKEKAHWEAKHEKLAKEREIFDQKATKMETIMKQFQGIQ
ncbi:rab9 effector protein with kelch motifs-like [Corticium candelabrum]|uniref:rab9 effector protein with kelch motifs-like n=1 Tax=Corticium candelabrum TaxID=121492 RepID=UPI002E26215A|nr:rab9 effector protein with kelch motifs-like [Corticium candelabrum]